MRTESEIKESLVEMERMAKDAKEILSNKTVVGSKVLTDKFTEWMHRSEARANILKWVLCLPYLEDEKPEPPSQPEETKYSDINTDEGKRQRNIPLSQPEDELFTRGQVKELLKYQRHNCQIERDKRSYHDNEGNWFVHCEDVLNAQEPKF